MRASVVGAGADAQTLRRHQEARCVVTIKLTIHGTGTGPCALTGKECDGLTVTFDDGTVTNSFLSWKAFRQLLGMKAGQTPKAAAPVAAVPAGNGEPLKK